MLTMKINIKVWLVFWLALKSFVFGIKSLSPLNINFDADVKISVCHFTKATKPTPLIMAICGIKGEACSIAAYFNQTEAQLQKTVNCDCWDVFVDTDQAIIPGKGFPNNFNKCTIEVFLNNTNLTFLAFLYKIDIKGFQNQQK